MVAVSPDDFLGDVVCADRGGAMQSYVATLIDVSDDLVDAGDEVKNFALPSSRPISCTHPVGFGRVVFEHRYVADIQGYEQANLKPAAPGSPVMLDADTEEVVTPRWHTRCGRVGAPGAAGPVSPLKLRTAYVTGCEPLVSASRPPLAAVRVSVEPALGPLRCGEASGKVDRFSILLGDSGEVHETDCGNAAVLVALSPGELVEIQLWAFEANSTTPRWSSTCRAVAQAGAVVQASCDPLVEQTE
jgi:hypothetical protein